MKIYLAGPIRGLTYGESTDWRNDFAGSLERIGHVGVTPMRGKEYLANKGRLTGDNYRGSYEEFPMSSKKGIYGRDSFDIRTCDVVLANLTGADAVSIGTCMEIQMARDLGKYVLVVLEEGNIHDHVFIHEAASLVVDDLGVALDVLAVLGQNYLTNEPARWALTPKAQIALGV